MLLQCLDTEHCLLPTGQRLTLRELSAMLTAVQRDSGVELLLPAQVSAITSIAVSGAEAKLLSKTLPWRLEESLLEPVETLHFAHGVQHEGHTAVTVVSKVFLQHWYSGLQEAGIRVIGAYSELSLLPWQSKQWTLWLRPTGELLLKHGWHDAVLCTGDNVAALLSQLRDQQQGWPTHIVIYGESQAAAQLQAELPAQWQSMLVTRAAPSWQQLHSQQSIPPCNVLQGQFAAPLPWQRWWQQWRLVAALLVALLVSDAVLNAWQGWRFHQQQAEVKQAMLALYRQVEPQGAVVDPVQQLQAMLSAGARRAQLLPLLTALVPALASESGVTVDTLDFDAAGGSVSLQVSSTAFSSIESLRSKLQNLGLQVELLSSSSSGNSSRANLQVKQS